MYYFHYKTSYIYLRNSRKWIMSMIMKNIKNILLHFFVDIEKKIDDERKVSSDETKIYDYLDNLLNNVINNNFEVIVKELFDSHIIDKINHLKTVLGEVKHHQIEKCLFNN